MTTFDDRESGFERKFATDEELEFKATARANRFLGLWAGELMGLEGQNLDDYAAAVVRAEVAGPGEEEVLRRINGDLTAAGVKVSEGQVLSKMQEVLAIAREQVKAGD
jgi:hypothetical protein